jgi:hypothetical protein
MLGGRSRTPVLARSILKLNSVCTNSRMVDRRRKYGHGLIWTRNYLVLLLFAEHKARALFFRFGHFFDPGFLFPLAPSFLVRFPQNPARSIPGLRIQCIADSKYFHNVFHVRCGEAPSFSLFTLPELERWSGSLKNLSGYSSRYILLHWIV